MTSRLVVDAGTLTRRHARIAHANAQRSWNEREGVVLELRAGGLVGAGEASPLPGYSQDDLEAAARELEGVAARLSAIDPGEDVRTTFRAKVQEAALRSPAAVFALETALLDLVAQARGLPAWAVLRGDRDAVDIPLNGLAEGATTAELVAAVARALERGLRVVKLKVGAGGTVTRDVERLGAVRSAFGRDVVLRLDANQVLPPASVPAALDALAPFDPELLEEPSTPACVDALPESPVRLALDESLVHADATARILALGERGLLGAVVLKPMALGGLDRCLSLAETAASVGLGVVVTHMFDGPVASASAACLALAVRGEVLACGLDARGRLESPVPAITDTFVRPFEETGLGIPRRG